MSPPIRLFAGSYNYIGVKHGILDTGSLVYEIETHDVYEDFSEDRSLFDLSNYHKDSRFYDPVYKR